MKRFIVSIAVIIFFLVSAFECSFRGASKTEVVDAKANSEGEVKMEVVNTSGEPIQSAHYNVRQTQKTGIAQDPLVTTWQKTVSCQFDGRLAPGDTASAVCGSAENVDADEVFLTENQEQ